MGKVTKEMEYGTYVRWLDGTALTNEEEDFMATISSEKMHAFGERHMGRRRSPGPIGALRLMNEAQKVISGNKEGTMNKEWDDMTPLERGEWQVLEMNEEIERYKTAMAICEAKGRERIKAVSQKRDAKMVEVKKLRRKHDLY